MDGWDTIVCETAEDFLHNVSPRSRHFLGANVDDWIFRGQAEASWDLRPSAFRPRARLLEMTRHGKRSWEAWTNDDQLHAEAWTLTRFMREVDNAGLPIPGDRETLERELWRILQVHPVWTPENPSHWPPRVTWPLVALAQHYGIATRFLDWTRSAYIAAYFAAVDVVSNSRSGDMAVWAFSTVSWDTVRWPSIARDRYPIVVTAPYASNPNLRAQRGIHVSVPVETLSLGAPAQRDDFAEQLAEVHTRASAYGTCALKQFLLPSTCAAALLWHLAKEGITGANLFPGYGGAAQSTLESGWRG